MGSHNAAGQMVGYLYQLRYALYLLLSHCDPLHQLSMEKYDDVAFDNDGEPKLLVQVKHHMRDANHAASLSDTSVDLWRTLNVWFDAVTIDNSLLDHTDFVIVTTADIPKGSAAESINGGEADKAYDILALVAQKQNKTNGRYYSKFLKANKGLVIRLLERTKVIASAKGSADIELKLREHLRFACTPINEDAVLDRLEGWWFRNCIEALSSPDPTIMTLTQLRAKIVEISHQYADDNLPIEFLDLDEINEKALNPKDKVFLEQLRLLRSGNRTLNNALQDYYRATRQRSSWLRQGLVFANELDTYEDRLVDEWRHAFGFMEDDLLEMGETTEEEMVSAGRTLYRSVTDKDLRIRPRVDERYIVRGTYHHLANSLIVGWHPDFAERLRRTMQIGEQS